LFTITRSAKSSKFYTRKHEKPDKSTTGTLNTATRIKTDSSSGIWRLKSREEFASSLSREEKERRGGVSKIEQQETNRYFKRSRLTEILLFHGNVNTIEEKDMLDLFIHFVKGKVNSSVHRR